jgi:hypothetical protein
MQLNKYKSEVVKNTQTEEKSYTESITDSISNLSNQFYDYFNLNNASSLVSSIAPSNFSISHPVPYSYFTEPLNYGLTGPFLLASGSGYATRINKEIMLSFNALSITGNGSSSVINFPTLPQSYSPITSGVNSFPVDILQAGQVVEGRININGNNMIIGSGVNCSPFTGSTNLQGYLAFNISFINSRYF